MVVETNAGPRKSRKTTTARMATAMSRLSRVFRVFVRCSSIFSPKEGLVDTQGHVVRTM